MAHGAVSSACRRSCAVTDIQQCAGCPDLRLVRLSNLLNISSKPFDPDTFEPAAEIVYQDARGKPRVILPDYNCIRFRNVTNPDGFTSVQSNSR